MIATKRRNMPIGIQTFSEIRKGGYAYVDKTEQVYRLTTSGKYYFLARPRRFGKSLMLSTIQAFYQGRKELFEGLAIAEHEDVVWEEHPVLHIDLNTGMYDKREGLENKLNGLLKDLEKLYGITDNATSLGQRLENIIRQAYQQTGRNVVILVDEYDKPMQEAIDKPALLEEFRTVLKDFYGAIKSADSCIQFVLLTGITKFGKVNIFSGLNNLNDITMDADYYDVCGITEVELKSNFGAEIETLANANGMTYDECVGELRRRYDGYHFEENALGIYNPFSVILTFQKKKFGSYWFETATPTMLVKRLQMCDYNLEALSHVNIGVQELSAVEAGSSNPISLIYQSGYLTIKGYNPKFGTYTLGFPNREVEEGFTEFLMPYYIHRREHYSSFLINDFVLDVEAGNTEKFLKRLKSLFADTPYEIIKDTENHYQNVLWLLYKLMGYYTQAEYHTSEGSVDLVVKTENFCYVMEFKFDHTAEEALAQIESKNYALPFALEGQKVIKVGLNFSRETRNIERYVIGE